MAASIRFAGISVTSCGPGFIVLALLCTTSCRAEQGVAPGADGEGEAISAHYVHLKGKVQERAMRESLKAKFQLCREARNIDPGALPDEPILQLDRRVYYARQATIAYETKTLFTVTPACGALRRTTYDKAELRTPKGVCKIDLREKTAAGIKGSCRVRAFVTATEELQPSAANAQQRLGQRMYAGASCQLFRLPYGGMVGDRCIRVPAGFSPYTDSVGFSSPAGLTLMVKVSKAGMEEPDDAIPYLEAQEVREGMRVPIDLFLPQFRAGFSISDGGSQ